MSKSSYDPYPTSLAVKVQRLGKLASAGALSAVRFIISVPSRLKGFYSLSRAERREIYKGWWQVVKKEAHHYWVSSRC